MLARQQVAFDSIPLSYFRSDRYFDSVLPKGRPQLLLMANREDMAVTDNQVRESREALLAILSTAASMGIDIDLLCHLAAEQLSSGAICDDVKPYVSGAIYQIGVCMNYVIDAP